MGEQERCREACVSAEEMNAQTRETAAHAQETNTQTQEAAACAEEANAPAEESIGNEPLQEEEIDAAVEVTTDEPAGDVPGALVVQADCYTSEEFQMALRNAYAEMEMEYEFDRAEMRTKARRSKVLFSVGTFLCTMLLVIVLYVKWPGFRTYLNYFMPEAATSTEETSAIVRETKEENEIKYVPPYQSVSFQTQLLSTGTPRLNSTTTTYYTLNCTVTLEDVYTPEDFEKSYGKTFTLSGTEAGATLKFYYANEDSSNKLDEIVPQDAFVISVITEDGSQLEEYQLMNKLIKGDYDAAVKAKNTVKLYKRYQHSEKAKYICLHYYCDGEAYDLYFALEDGDTAVAYDTLKQNDRGERVKRLNTKLKELGYLSATAGEQYNKYTVQAVKDAQAAFGLEQTGEADDALQHKLFDAADESGEEPAEAASAEGETAAATTEDTEKE